MRARDPIDIARDRRADGQGSASAAVIVVSIVALVVMVALGVTILGLPGFVGGSRTLTVEFVTFAGDPAIGVPAKVWTVGPTPQLLGSGLSGVDGAARFTGLPAVAVQISWGGEGSSWASQARGDPIDLRSGDAVVTVTATPGT